jgi:hypothetical protein
LTSGVHVDVTFEAEMGPAVADNLRRVSLCFAFATVTHCFDGLAVQRLWLPS